MQAAGEEQLRSAAIREMRAVMMRVAKGEVAMYLEMWRSNKKLAWMDQADALKAKLEAELRSGQQGAALRQVAMVMAGVMRGVKGSALQSMRMAMADDRRERELGAMQAAGEEQLRSAAIREMRAVMMRRAKSDTMRHINNWRLNIQCNAIREMAAVTAATSIAVRNQIEEDFRLKWAEQANSLRARLEAELAAIHAVNNMRLRRIAIRQMRVVIRRLGKKDANVCLVDWRMNATGQYKEIAISPRTRRRDDSPARRREGPSWMKAADAARKRVQTLKAEIADTAWLSSGSPVPSMGLPSICSLSPVNSEPAAKSTSPLPSMGSIPGMGSW